MKGGDSEVNLWNKRWEITCIVTIILLAYSALWIHDVILYQTNYTHNYTKAFKEVARFTEIIEFPTGILLAFVLWFLIDKKTQKNTKNDQIQKQDTKKKV